MNRSEACAAAGRSLKRISIAAVMIAFVLLLAACGSSGGGSGRSAADPVVGENYLLDTVCTVSVYRIKDEDGNVVPAADAEEAANAAIDEAFRLCAALDKKLSRTNAASEISAVNNAGGEWVDVSEDTLELIQKGVEYSRMSDGGFDITVGGITEQWDFHADEGEAKIPDGDALAEAVKHINYSNIEIEGNRVRLSDPATKLDLGGIAKGYIGDRMTELLESRGVVSAVINLGGNVICIGGKTDEDDFVIGVETPFSDRTEIIGKIDARDKTLVTSGVYERQIEVDGKKYHHILDTKTGWPVETDLDAVTLIADKGCSADIDALSTTCLILGADEGMKLIDKTDGVEGVFVLSDGDIRETDGAGLEAVK